MGGLTMYVNFIVPTDVGKPLMDSIKAAIIDRWGGLTAIAGEGQWKSPSGEVVGGPVVNLGVDVGKAWVGDVDKWFYGLACKLHIDGKQQAVYYRVGGHGRTVTWAVCPACGLEVWDTSSADQRLSKCWGCGQRTE